MDNGLTTRITSLRIDSGLAEALTAFEVARNRLDQAEGPDMVEAVASAGWLRFVYA